MGVHLMSDRRHKLVSLAAELAADFATRTGELLGKVALGIGLDETPRW
jgi:hypothetical protein